MSEIPKTLNYSSIKPLGFPATVKTVHFTPQSYQSYSSMSDIIRFIINTDGYLDPYNTYIQIEVDVSDAPKDSFIIQQIDGSAHSFISEFRAEANNVEIERIQEYDVLANLLYDVHYGGSDRLQRQHEGLGLPMKAGTQSLQYGQNLNNLGIMLQQKVDKTVTLVSTGQGYRPFLDNKAAYNYSSTRTAINQDLGTSYSDNIYNYVGLSTANLYTLATTLTDYRLLPIPERVDIGFNQDTLEFPDYDNDQQTANQQNFNTIGSKGLYVDSFCNTAFEPSFINKNFWENSDQHCQQVFPKPAIINGTFGQYGSTSKNGLAKNHMTKQRFYIPLMSSIFGILMPKESFKYIPMKLFKDLILEFRLNPYAMFTSGYINDVDNSAPTNATFSHFGVNKDLSQQQKRFWRITKFEIWTDLMIFDQTMDSVIESQLNSGLLFHSQGFALGPLFQLDKTQSAAGTFQVNLGFESLRDVLVHYQSNDYIDYSFCRKNYRLSNNLTSIQLRIGNNYYPYLKIEGHGGNAYTNYNAANNDHNGQFIINLHKVFGKLHDSNQKIFINTWNFCPNERPYDVSNTKSFLKTGDGSLQNSDTAIGMPFIYENSCIGKAIYGINVEVLSNDYSRISGINTMQQRPFEITTTVGNSTSTNAVSRDRKRTMYIWCHYDYILKIDASGIHVLGKS